MTESVKSHTPCELVVLWSETAAARLRTEQAKQGTLSGTELNHLGELLISAATWLCEDAAAAKRQAREDRVAAFRRSPECAAMSPVEQIMAAARVL